MVQTSVFKEFCRCINFRPQRIKRRLALSFNAQDCNQISNELTTMIISYQWLPKTVHDLCHSQMYSTFLTIADSVYTRHCPLFKLYLICTMSTVCYAYTFGCLVPIKLADIRVRFPTVASNITIITKGKNVEAMTALYGVGG